MDDNKSLYVPAGSRFPVPGSTNTAEVIAIDPFELTVTTVFEGKTNILHASKSFIKKPDRSKWRSDPSNTISSLIPQVQPVAKLLFSVKSKDGVLFESILSSITKDALTADGLTLIEAQNMSEKKFKDDFGEYYMQDLIFDYCGERDSTRGRVQIIYKGKRFSSWQVVKEGAEWKIDEP